MFLSPHKVHAAATFLKRHFRQAPQIVIVGGSGMTPPKDFLEHAQEIPVGRIPHFRKPCVAGHAGRLLCGTIGKTGVWLQLGRNHFYEGSSWQELLLPLRVYKACGAQTMFLTNAAGAVNPRFKTGDWMLLTDHINAMGSNPLIGPNDDKLGPRFPSMSDLYDPALRALALRAARKHRWPLRQGVYAAVTGPSYETRAEIRALRRLGADAVGMSTVPEAIFAHYLGMKVFAISLITNAPGTPTHTDVLKTAHRSSQRLFTIIKEMIRNTGHDPI